MRPKASRRGFGLGKIRSIILERSVFSYLGRQDKRVLVGPGIGRDAAIVRVGNRVLAFSTDPITGAVRHIGRHAVHVNANDVAVAGAKPVWFLVTLLVPPGTRETQLRSIMKEIHDEALRLGVSVVRGHTEATSLVRQPIVTGFMIGEAKSGRIVASSMGRAGDKVVMTKTAGIEGTAALAADHSGLLKQRGLDLATIKKAERLIGRISLVREAAVASKTPGVSAMHDPTEGGVLNGLWELAEASTVGIEVEEEKIPVAMETARVCQALGLNPLRLLSSGCLLIACSPEKTRRLLSSLDRVGVDAVEIARLTRGPRVVCRFGKSRPLGPVYRDELYSI